MLDWLGREGWIVLSWWVLVTLAGIAALPLCFRLMRALPDWGYTLARAAGLLLVGFVYWLLASFGFLRNSTGDMLLAWLITLGLGLLVYFRAGDPINLSQWWRENRRVILVGEILFAVLLLGWAVYRAHMNYLTGTEKPMELMMMSSVARSDTFPPNDGWMSGYAISYYHFGYILSAMLSMLSGIPTTTGFNMMASLLFALTGLTSFGVAYNLVRARAHFDEVEAGWRTPHTVAVGAGLLAAVFVVAMGNFELPFVEVPYQTTSATQDYLQFWNVDDRQVPQTVDHGLDAGQWGHWWWWPASRVVNDLDLQGSHIEVIDEFPAFSFVLSDVHPHVLALPFVMLVIGLALNLALSPGESTWLQTGFYALAVGGLAFLNTWDAPIYLVLLVGADALRRIMQSERGRLTGQDWQSLFLFGGTLLGAGILLYIPFWLGFRSQAGGILPNLITPTIPQQFFLMFGPFLLLLMPFLIVEAWRGGRRMNWFFGLGIALLSVALLVAGMLVLTALGWSNQALRGEAIRMIDQAGGMEIVMPLLLDRRLQTILTTAVLLIGLVIVIARLFPNLVVRKPRSAKDSDSVVTYAPSTGFTLLLVGAGLLLALAPEYVYLRDNFGSRMNTVFKFYYQAWLLFSIAAAYGVYSVIADARLREPGTVVRALHLALVAVVVTVCVAYTVMGVYSRALIETGRANTSQPSALTLDGGRSFASLDDYESIMCLNGLVQGDDAVVAEAIGGAYRNEFGRVAALTGIPIVLGWENHEGQWRGPTYTQVAGSRGTDIPLLYTDPRWEVADEIIHRYGIDYIFFGQTERNSYGTGGEDKFREHLEPVCERGASLFYRVTQAAPAVAG